MDEQDDFRRAIRRFADEQPNKTAAAQALGISRQDLYRYSGGSTAPRPLRRRHMMRILQPVQQRPASPRNPADLSRLDVESVTFLRDILIHLVSLLDLDLAGREVDELKNG